MKDKKWTFDDTIAEMKRVRLNNNTTYSNLKSTEHKLKMALKQVQEGIKRFEDDDNYVGEDEWVTGWRVYNLNDV
jgi:hypothetical protein